jgi:N-acetylneuraminic acid mutarotase
MYISRHFDIYVYHVAKDEWDQLPASAYQSFCMAILENRLTTIGGISRDQTRTNCLYSLVGGRAKEWDELYPPIPTHRVCAAALSTPTHLVVAGGRDRGELTTIEVMSKENYQWSRAVHLPEPMGNLQMVLCAGHLYICMQQAFYSYSLENLLRSCYESDNTSDRNDWAKLTDIPTYSGHSLCCLEDQVLVVGGCNDSDQETAAVYGYDSDNASWRERGEMPTPRIDTLAASVEARAEEAVVVVGGWSNANNYSITEIGTQPTS